MATRKSSLVQKKSNEASKTAAAPRNNGNPAKKVPAVQRAADILWLLGNGAPPSTLSQIARGVGILPSTCLHILRELAAARLVAFDPEQKTYQLGKGLLELSGAVLRQDNFADVVRPHLQVLASRYGVTATAAARIDQDHMVVVCVAHPAEGLSLRIETGSRLPVLAGASGRCMAAFGGKTTQQLQQAFGRLRWQGSITFKDWLAQVERVRTHGYAEDDSQYVKGVVMIAVPVVEPEGGAIRTIGINAIAEQFPADKRAKVLASMLETARQVSSRLRA